MNMHHASAAKRILNFYVDGFRSMKLGRTLWKIILLKLLVIFAVLKLFFFPDTLKTNFTSDTDRADHVMQQLTRPGTTGEGVAAPITGATVSTTTMQHKEVTRD